MAASRIAAALAVLLLAACASRTPPPDPNEPAIDPVVARARCLGFGKSTLDRKGCERGGARTQVFSIVPGAGFGVAAQASLGLGACSVTSRERFEVSELDEAVGHQAVAAIEQVEHARVARVALMQRLELDELRRERGVRHAGVGGSGKRTGFPLRGAHVVFQDGLLHAAAQRKRKNGCKTGAQGVQRASDS